MSVWTLRRKCTVFFKSEKVENAMCPLILSTYQPYIYPFYPIHTKISTNLLSSIVIFRRRSCALRMLVKFLIGSHGPRGAPAGLDDRACFRRVASCPSYCQLRVAARPTASPSTGRPRRWPLSGSSRESRPPATGIARSRLEPRGGGRAPRVGEPHGVGCARCMCLFWGAWRAC